mmetsp:Transcript_6148/g.12721  ORF Transcript_6148/g.12721 Transcript_6148/m.12721 type:complete len:317 (-) Transcript_6148:47-997(-)
MRTSFKILQFLLASVAITSCLAFAPTNHGHGSIPSTLGGAGEKRSVACAVKRMPIMMPTQEPMVPYRDSGSDYASFVGLNSALLRDRKLWIGKFIDDNASNDIISSLIYLTTEADNAYKPVELYLNVPGALLRPSLAIYDVIQQLKSSGKEIITTNFALCAGMGSLIAAAGTKGKRRVMPNARFLLQKTGIDSVFQGQATDIALEVKNVKTWNQKIIGELSELTGQPYERIEQDLKRDFYLSSDEAVRYGLCDEVLLPSFGKMGLPVNVDLGSFSSGEDQKYQRDRPEPEEQKPTTPAKKKKGDDDDDGPQIAGLK